MTSSSGRAPHRAHGSWRRGPRRRGTPWGTASSRGHPSSPTTWLGPVGVTYPCSSPDNGERSPYQVAVDVEGASGTPEDTAAVLELAAETCTDHGGDLLAFRTDNLVQSAEDLTAFADERWPGALAGTPELMALAQMVCVSSTNPFEVEASDSLIETGLDTGAADEFRGYVTENMCG